MKGSTLIVATDLSESATHAARWATAVGRLTGVPVVVSHVIEIGFDSWIRSRYAINLDEAQRAQVRDEVAHWFEVATGEPPSGVDVRVDFCVTGLQDAVAAYDGALLVMAPTGKGAVSRAVLGSRVQQLASNPPCPLVIVSPDAAPPEKRPRIAACTDFSAASYLAVELGGSLARMTGGTLNVLYALQLPPGPFFEGINVEGGLEPGKLEEQALIDLRVLVRERLPGLADVEPRVLVGRASDQISRFAEEEKLDVLVMGQTGHTSAPGDLLGSTPRRIIRNLPCTVIITPRPAA